DWRGHAADVPRRFGRRPRVSHHPSGVRGPGDGPRFPSRGQTREHRSRANRRGPAARGRDAILSRARAASMKLSLRSGGTLSPAPLFAALLVVGTISTWWFAYRATQSWQQST